MSTWLDLFCRKMLYEKYNNWNHEREWSLKKAYINHTNYDAHNKNKSANGLNLEN